MTYGTCGKKLLMDYLEQPNETIRDLYGDVEAIVAILDTLENIHRVFLEMLIDLHGSFSCVAEAPCEDDAEDDCEDCDDCDDCEDPDFDFEW
jgi:hypothetical protein